VTFAVELEGGNALIGELLRRGIVPSCTHSAATAAEFAAAYACGLRDLSHFCNQMTPLHHRDIGLVGSGLLHDDVNVEFICDKLHISPEMIKLVFKVKGAGRVMLITDAMRAAGMPEGEYTLGGLPVHVGADGAARLTSNGALAGSTLQLNVALKNIVEITGLPLFEAVKSSSLTAAESLNWTKLGRLEPGRFADLAVLDSDYSVYMTIVAGEIRYTRK
jgi:N-acetylglucosamine-6-phosphate deacetylase